MIESASWRSTGKFSRRIGRRREPKVDPKAAQGKSETQVEEEPEGGARDSNAEEPEVGFAGRVGRLAGGASRRLAGQQRRRDPAVEESEVEFRGQAERLIEDASRRNGREAEPEMQQTASDVWSVRQGRKVDRRCKPQVRWTAAPKGLAVDESRRLDSKAQLEGD